MAVRTRLRGKLGETWKGKDETVSELEQHITAGQNALRSKIEAVDRALKTTTGDVIRKGKKRQDIKDAVRKRAIEIEEKTRQRPEDCKDPEAGLSKAKAIKVTTFIQEMMLLNELSATPIRFYMTKEGDRYYEEVLTLRRWVIKKTKEAGWEQCRIFFDVTAIHEEIKEITGRDTTNKPFYGLMACGKCTKPNKDGRMLQCARCKSVAYCNVECQKEHYTKGHRVDCLGIADEYAKAIEAESKRAVYMKEQEEKGNITKDKRSRYLSFELRHDLGHILDVFITTVIDKNDLYDEKAIKQPERFFVNHTMERETKNDEAAKALAEMQTAHFKVRGVGWRPALKDGTEPKDCDVLCVVLDDEYQVVPRFIRANGGEPTSTTEEDEGIKVDFVYVTKGSGEKYVDTARYVVALLAAHDDIRIDQRSEYLFNQLQSQEDLIKSCEITDFSMKYVTDHRLGIVARLRQIALIPEEAYISVESVHVASGEGGDTAKVNLKRPPVAMERFKGHTAVYTVEQEEKEKQTELLAEDMRKTVFTHTSFN